MLVLINISFAWQRHISVYFKAIDLLLNVLFKQCLYEK